MGYTASALAGFESVDIIVGTIIGIACLRGFFLGLIREAFSLASLGAAYMAVQAFVSPVAKWVGEIGDGRVSEALAPWVAGALLVLVTIGAVMVALTVALHAIGTTAWVRYLSARYADEEGSWRRRDLFRVLSTTAVGMLLLHVVEVEGEDVGAHERRSPSARAASAKPGEAALIARVGW